MDASYQQGLLGHVSHKYSSFLGTLMQEHANYIIGEMKEFCRLLHAKDEAD